jgi:hypothetical protein
MNLSVGAKGRRVGICGGTVLIGGEVIANTVALLLLHAHECAAKDVKICVIRRNGVSRDRPSGPQALIPTGPSFIACARLTAESLVHWYVAPPMGLALVALA